MKCDIAEWGGDAPGDPPRSYRIELHAETMQDAALLVRMAQGYKSEPVECSACVGKTGSFMGLVWVPRSIVNGEWISKKKGH